MQNCNKPILKPSCSGWRKDLNLPTTDPELTPSTNFLNSNYFDNTYLELSRRSVSMRGIAFPLFVIGLSLFSIMIPDIIIEGWEIDDSIIFFGGLFCLLCSTWILTCYFRYAFSPPRDEPIRFNYPRQKIYAYNFDMCWWNPFIPWPVRVVAYDWAHVRAERWKKRASTLQGSHIVKVGIMLSIVEPGTNNVIDRFPLSNENDDESIWAYICTYMQHGSSAVPTPPPGRDHDDVLWYQYTMRLAPRVNWPKDIDLESRTAP